MANWSGFFTWTENEARQEMEKLAGCKVLPCVFPTKLEYYISEHGELFSLQNLCGRYYTLGPKKPVKKKSGGVTCRLTLDKGREVSVPCESLVYCTFVVGIWSPDLRLEFINGCRSDVRVDNIRPVKKRAPIEWTERLEQFKGLYEERFEDVVIYIKFYSDIDVEDAKDIAQSTFIWLATSGFKGQVNPALWKWYGIRRAIDFKKAYTNRLDPLEKTEIMNAVVEDLPHELDLVAKLKGDKSIRYFRMYAEGVTPRQIAKAYGDNENTVNSILRRCRLTLQRYLKHEIEQYG